jgi:hypothetical protein
VKRIITRNSFNIKRVCLKKNSHFQNKLLNLILNKFLDFLFKTNNRKKLNLINHKEWM